ncbi:amidase [Sistotremastrum suecicum HHB10207 ss-3]|uniref:amidase n=1 Tax=Sistotremastrum suecicum HHB10207 ss-3 TaxID=1314776 RepID=A0A166ALK8_9AGAM|nr:amidase [Sistotremastrum suecicum HHB10207 ss-3]
MDWQSRSRQRKQQQLDSIPSDWRVDPPSDDQLNVIDFPRTCGLLTPFELEITEADIEVLLFKLAHAEWSCLDVTRAFYKRAVVAQQLTNCLTEIFVDRALEQARELDEYLRIHGKPKGPLHGLPISDQFTIKGLETIMGYVGWIGNIADRDCVIVEILRECGANIFVRTNVPQTLIWGETFNHVFGRTVNPYNRLCTPGGSSGGEGALLAMRGSAIGVGTDIGGSVRIPSAFCGLYTLRPSYERLPYQGALNSAQGQESISSVLGPMTNSIAGVKIFTKAVLDAKPWTKDPLCFKKSWDEAGYQLAEHGNGKSLCFAMLWDNGVIKPHPPMYRAMKMVKAALEAAGHKVVVDWVNYKHMDLFHVAEYIWAADGVEAFTKDCALSGEPLVQLEHFTTDETRDLYKLDIPPLNKFLWQLHKQKRQLRKEYLDHWEATVEITGTGRPVDGIISPPTPYGATPHGLNTDAFYTTLWNILDYATAGFPVTTVDPILDAQKPPPHEFYNHEDEAIYNLCKWNPVIHVLEAHLFYPDDVELFKDSPIGLQITGRTLEEEAVIGMAELIDAALKAHHI